MTNMNDTLKEYLKYKRKIKQCKKAIWGYVLFLTLEILYFVFICFLFFGFGNKQLDSWFMTGLGVLLTIWYYNFIKSLWSSLLVNINKLKEIKKEEK